ncbi:class I SAM-dependent methyltransferase [Rubinisphaera brasiliensis]|uniref:Class I SAM-dependent methyltransferase n=1 Tax=Rubinisphaera brasiliensis (strain ATCC 49424 / DSM 5305 / JCM 21570 / IAM 15109 / NBRC 103401 / IFAM 1448) TaxID=756272 RepID=F0SI39_RUBBR|nr:class I SAM-dependent methyltransferase [Rubinisphaera brasiliensis]ADY61741.1 hypothetical protein Plabr_4167 [Rubinisphaera brasiliensis DSM 5305]
MIVPFFCSTRREPSESRIEEALAISQLSKLQRTYLPMTSSSMTPPALLFIANEIFINNRRKYIECGAGTSTIIAGYAMEPCGGSVVSIEHDADWKSVMEAEIERHGLAEIITIIHCPLQSESDLEWYSLPSTGSGISGEYDFLVVDGPPAYQKGKEQARLPASFLIREHMADNCTVMLDDISRPGEQAVLASWKNEFPSFTYSTTERFAICRRGRSFNAL